MLEAVRRLPREVSFAHRSNRHGHTHAQRQGVKFGRKPGLTPEQTDDARELIARGESRQYVADLVNVSRWTPYRELSG
jgi:DNA invertase Pin-like site-specific DNA recombinase